MNAVAKPYSEACDQNREPILAVIAPLFADRAAVLEIGSGTGQHAVFFAARLPQLRWHASDLAEHHPGIRLWLEEAGLANLSGPIALDVLDADWQVPEVDAVFSANTAHIMSAGAVAAMFAGVGRTLPAGGLFVLYGPFNYDRSYTSESNARFDAWLKARDPASGIRDFEDLDALAAANGMRLLRDFGMPANNRTLCWRREGRPSG